MAWNLTAQVVESCSCNMLCPCWFGVQELMVMDQGWCDSALLFHIREGNSDGVDLDGCTVVLAGDFPGPTLFDGNGTQRLYVDEAATAQQRRELEAIFQGTKGGPMEIIAGLTTKWLPTQFVNIEIREEDNVFTATVGDFGKVRSAALQDEEGRPMTMQNVGFASALQFDKLTAQLAPSGTQWFDRDLPRPFETRSGVRSTCHWSVN